MLARIISRVENHADGYEQILKDAADITSSMHTIGITGPPGVGKSTLIGGLIDVLVKKGKKVAVLAVDPTSPFHHGALLGDRIRMLKADLQAQVFIRSLASRGSLGGLHPRIIEIIELIRAAGFDDLVIETVGVGQSEVEIAGLTDTTIVVVAPESGDAIQSMKAGLMEIADLFVINKSDRPEADIAVRNIKNMVRHKKDQCWAIPIIQAVATEESGLEEIIDSIDKHILYLKSHPPRKAALLAKKAWQLIATKRMKDIDAEMLQNEIEKEMDKESPFNLYEFVRSK